MAKKCSNPGCDKETNNKGGICAGCMIEMSYRSSPLESVNVITAEKQKNCRDNGGTENMANIKGAVIKEKICIDCGNAYAPMSNVQKRCPECKANHKPSAKGKGQRAKDAPLMAGKEGSVKKPTAKKKGIGTIMMPKEGRASIVVAFLSYEYPKLYHSLSTLFGEAGRTGAMKELLKPHLAKMEAAL